MQARVLLWFCLGLNILLAVMVILLARDSQRQVSWTELTVQGKNPAKQIKTNVVVRRQPITWSELESSDYPKYIINLRRAGCPEKTIRDIIVADVNDLFAERIAREIVFPEQKWWLPDPDLEAYQEGINQLHALENEKNGLLNDLLGPDWAKTPTSIATIASLESRPGLYSDAMRFDGAVLGKLSAETKASVRQIEARARQLREELTERARQSNRQPSAGELALINQETRRQLAGVLSGEQLEEYLLRYSQTAEQMREQLRGYGAEADEFRRIFRVRDTYDQQLASLTGDDPGTVRRRAEIETQREESIRQSLGAERYAFYQVTQNPLFRQAQEQAEQNGAPPEKVLPIFRVNQAVQDEVARIQADRNISDDQRKVALVTIQQQQQNSIERILSNSPAEMLPEARPVVQSVPIGPLIELPLPLPPPRGLVYPPLPPRVVATP